MISRMSYVSPNKFMFLRKTYVFGNPICLENCFCWGRGSRAASRRVGPAHLGSPGPGPEHPVKDTTLSPSKPIGLPKHGGHDSTVVSQRPRRGCRKRRTGSSTRSSQSQLESQGLLPVRRHPGTLRASRTAHV